MLFLVNFELGNIVEILALAATTIGLLVSLYTARKDRKNNTQIQLLEERLKTYNDLCFMSKQLAMPIDIRLYQSKYIEDFNNKTNEVIKDLFLLNNKIRALFDEELYNWSKNLIVNIEKESSSITEFLKYDICKSVDVSDENIKKAVKDYLCSKGKRKKLQKNKNARKIKKYSDEICSEETYMKYFRKYFNVEDKNVWWSYTTSFGYNKRRIFKR